MGTSDAGCYRVSSTMSAGSSPWRLTNWHVTPQQLGFAILSSGGSNWQIDGTLEDPTLTYPNLNSSTPTAFPLVTASSTTPGNQISALTTTPVAAYRLTLNAPSSVGAKVTMVSMQAGIG